MRNRIFRDVTISGRFAIKQKEESFFGLLKKLRYFRTMEDEMIDYGFEEDSVRRELVLWRFTLSLKAHHLTKTFDLKYHSPFV